MIAAGHGISPPVRAEGDDLACRDVVVGEPPGDVARMRPLVRVHLSGRYGGCERRVRVAMIMRVIVIVVPVVVVVRMPMIVRDAVLRRYVIVRLGEGEIIGVLVIAMPENEPRGKGVRLGDLVDALETVASLREGEALLRAA